MMLEKCLSYCFVLLFGTIFIVVLIICACSENAMSSEKARSVLNDFYTDNVPEPINRRHLISAGKAIVPYLLIEIRKKDMPKRGYAILALGEIKDKRAIPILIQILNDKTEEGYFRADALRAIWHINKELGEKYANQLFGQNADIDAAAQLLREGKI